MPTLKNFIRTGRFSQQFITDDLDLEDNQQDIPPHVTELADKLYALAQSLPKEDPKFDQLSILVDNSLNGPGPKKVLIFSYFLHTLSYLETKLKEKGYRVALITGKVKDEDRETLRDLFRLPGENRDSIDILLSSEVGCEGLDYEFCDRLVNYDIPWNPMRIEQRIGRIDRFGQEADKVLIFNFITPGTVEERIFFRCFERLGVFRDAVGDLEDVLGDLVQGLNEIVLDLVLNSEQMEEKAHQMADNAIRIIEEGHRLEEDSPSLIGFEESFLRDVDGLIADRRFVAPDELLFMIRQYVELPHLAGRITEDEKERGIYRLRLKKESRAILSSELQKQNRHDRPTVHFDRWLQGMDPYYLMTFDQQIALNRRQLPFITPVHPLARLAIEYWANPGEPLVSFLRIINDDHEIGKYLFIVDLWETIGIRSEISLRGFAWNFTKSRFSPEVSEFPFKAIDQIRRFPGKS